MRSSFYFCIYSTSGGTVSFLILSCQSWFSSAWTVRSLHAPLNKPLTIKRSWARENSPQESNSFPHPRREQFPVCTNRKAKQQQGEEEKERRKRKAQNTSWAVLTLHFIPLKFANKWSGEREALLKAVGLRWCLGLCNVSIRHKNVWFFGAQSETALQIWMCDIFTTFQLSNLKQKENKE